ncbi:MAG: type II secretion system protein [Planctomycetes bacterium]|nr:type II secretion system protein [Planctomycetota bacterium]
MKSIVKHSSRKAAFTIIELLTVMSIIVILIGLLVPSLNMARRFAKKLTQKNQLRIIGIGIEFFNNEWDGYPPSSAFDGSGQQYCGAMKLTEAMVGKDLLGFHPDSAFRADGLDTTGRLLYDPVTLGARKELFLQLDNANVNMLSEIYGPGNTGSFNENNFVLCDIYRRDMRSGRKTGMPVLYYKAETSNKLHDPNFVATATDNNGNIYNFNDNQAIFALGKPWEDTGNASTISLSSPTRFYRNTRNDKISTLRRPYKTDSYILISAGFDGEYGTADDICNFEWKYRE